MGIFQDKDGKTNALGRAAQIVGLSAASLGGATLPGCGNLQAEQTYRDNAVTAGQRYGDARQAEADASKAHDWAGLEAARHERILAGDEFNAARREYNKQLRINKQDPLTEAERLRRDKGE